MRKKAALMDLLEGDKKPEKKATVRICTAPQVRDDPRFPMFLRIKKTVAEDSATGSSVSHFICYRAVELQEAVSIWAHNKLKTLPESTTEWDYAPKAMQALRDSLGDRLTVFFEEHLIAAYHLSYQVSDETKQGREVRSFAGPTPEDIDGFNVHSWPAWLLRGRREPTLEEMMEEE